MLCITIVLLLAGVQAGGAKDRQTTKTGGDWPQYLGPDRNGTSSERGFDTDWAEQEPEVLWRQPLGIGFGGASVSRGRVYVLDRVDDERDLFRCLDLYTGEALWQYAYDDPGEYSFNGSRAAPTIHEGRAYCVGSMGKVHCFDLTDEKPVWSRDFREDFDAELPMWAYSQSPVVYENLVIVAPQCEQAGVVAYHKDTGEVVWTTTRLCEEAGYVSPTLVTISNVPQIIQVTPYLSPDYEEPEEDEDEEDPEASAPLVGKTVTVEFEDATYRFAFPSKDQVRISGGLAGQGMDGEYWQVGDGVFMEVPETLFIEAQYDGEVFDIMEAEEIEEEPEEEDEEDELEEEGPGFDAGGVYGIDAQTGKILWNYKEFNCRWPIPPITPVGDGRLLITAGYEAATALIQVESQGGQYQVRELFRNSEIQSQIHPAILHDKHLFMIGNGNAKQDGLMCLSLDGRVLWKTGRKPNFDRGGFLIADNKIFIVDGRRGDLYGVLASSEGYQELGRMKLLKGGKIWSPLALSNGMLVLRDQKQIVCVKLNRDEDPGSLARHFIGAGRDQGIVATASSTDDAAEAFNTVNGSGLLGEIHDRKWINTWTSDGEAGNPAEPSPNPARAEGQWIHYDLGCVRSLGRMHVWNGTEVSGRGLKRVTIDHSLDCAIWQELGTFEFPKASESDRYDGFAGPDFGGIQARHVLLTIHSNHGDEFGYALSEIRIASDASGLDPDEGGASHPTEPIDTYAPPDMRQVLAKADRFEALGNTDPNHRASRRTRGEVVVTFDQMPTRMSFNLPSFPCLVTENKISYYNGWTETYDAAAGVGSCEPLMDRDNVYSRMWIASQNDARIVVRWRGALVSSKGIIAHKDAPQVSPYGPGDWMDEWYIIYPDGVHVRKSKIYTHFAPQAKPFGWDREPPNYIFEFQEMLFLGQPGHLPEDDIHTKALSLIKMNGDHTTISYDPYPVHFGPDEAELYRAFGDYAKANIFVVNTKSKFHPFTIGRTEGVSISPYAPERRSRRGIFQSWPQNPNREEGYGGTALGHIILRSFYQRTDTTLTQIYLSGFTDAEDPRGDLVPLARSWLNAPGVTLVSPEGDSAEYDSAQRAYLIDQKKTRTPQAIQLEIAASKDSPVVNPAFLINHWGKEAPALTVNGSDMKQGQDFCFGHYTTLDVEDGSQWKDVLIVWIQMQSEKPVQIQIRRP